MENCGGPLWTEQQIPYWGLCPGQTLATQVNGKLPWASVDRVFANSLPPLWASILKVGLHIPRLPPEKATYQKS